MAWEDYKDEPTEDLIEYIRSKDDPAYLEMAKEASMVFMYRFEDQVVQKCRVMCAGWNQTETTADEIANRTLERFLKNPKFNRDKCKRKNVDDCVKFYLFRMAENLLRSQVRQQQALSESPYDGNEAIMWEINTEKPDLSVEKRAELIRLKELLDNALGRLSQKHRVIYLTYRIYQRDGRQMPRHLLKELREALDLTQSSVQVYKKEAFDTVTQYLQIYDKK